MTTIPGDDVILSDLDVSDLLDVSESVVTTNEPFSFLKNGKK